MGSDPGKKITLQPIAAPWHCMHFFSSEQKVAVVVFYLVQIWHSFISQILTHTYTGELMIFVVVPGVSRLSLFVTKCWSCPFIG